MGEHLHLDLDKLGASSPYAFGIVLEAKARAMVVMTKKIHPEWDTKTVSDFLHNAIDYAVKSER